jgi:hypothetical protein
MHEYHFLEIWLGTGYQMFNNEMKLEFGAIVLDNEISKPNITTT